MKTRVQVDLGRSDDAAWPRRLNGAAIVLHWYLYSLLIFDRARRSSLLLFSLHFLNALYMNPVNRKPFRHSPLLNSIYEDACIHRIGASTYTGINLARQLLVIAPRNFKITDSSNSRPESIFWTLSLLLSQAKKLVLDPLTITTIAHLCKLSRLHSITVATNRTQVLASDIHL